MTSQDLYLGIDVGSVSVNLAVMDAQDNIIEEQYIRHQHPESYAAGAPIPADQRTYGSRSSVLAETQKATDVMQI